MTPLQEQEFIKMQNDVAKMSGKVEEIYQALVGNQLSGDGGIRQKLKDHDEQLESVDLKVQVYKSEIDKKFQEFETNFFHKIEEMKISNAKTEVYIRIIWALAASGATGLIAFIIKYIVK